MNNLPLERSLMSPPVTCVERKDIDSRPSIGIAPNVIQFQHSFPLHRIYVHQVWSPVKRHRHTIFLLSPQPKHENYLSEYIKWGEFRWYTIDIYRYIILTYILLGLTKNLKVERGSPLEICVGDDDGSPADIMQIRDCHWFLPSESPTNITLLPLILIRNSAPLNLHQ